MKPLFTFQELSKVFAQVAKVEETSRQFVELNNKYAEVDAAFDDEFAKYGYTFFRAPQELHDMFDKKCAMMKERDKAERKAYRTIKEFGELVGIGEGYMDIIEEKVKQYIDTEYHWQAPEMVVRVKHLALDASRKININA